MNMVNWIEKKSMELAKILIRKKYGKFEVVAGKKQGCDIKVGNRFIEVKGRETSKPKSIRLTKKELETLLSNKKSYIYYFYNLKKKPKLKIFRKKHLIKMPIETIIMFRLKIPSKVWNKLKERNLPDM